MKETKNKKGKEKDLSKEINPAGAAVQISKRGRIFEGIVKKKFPKRIVIELERTLFVPKYERFYKKKTRIHARLPEGMNVEVGDYVKIMETRPLSKIINSIVIEKIKSGDKLLMETVK